MTNLTTFNYLSNKLRVEIIDGHAHFVVKDACIVLGFHVKADGSVNTTHALRHCNQDEIITRRMSGNRGVAMKLITESGLYKLIMRADKPEARQFQDWVTREVLPAIRKDGGYIAGEEKVKTGELSEDELVFRAMEVMQRKVEAHVVAQIHAANAASCVP